jgi:DNA polymerase I-like protein with 3'-5' exonuclease and polymerase domains
MSEMWRLFLTPTQRTAADVKKKALALLPRRLTYSGAKINGPVNDEIILEVSEEMANDAAAPSQRDHDCSTTIIY